MRHVGICGEARRFGARVYSVCGTRLSAGSQRFYLGVFSAVLGKFLAGSRRCVLWSIISAICKFRCEVLTNN